MLVRSERTGQERFRHLGRCKIADSEQYSFLCALGMRIAEHARALLPPTRLPWNGVLESEAIYMLECTDGEFLANENIRPEILYIQQRICLIKNLVLQITYEG